MSASNAPPAIPRRLARAYELIAHGRVTQSRKEPSTYHVSALDNARAYVVSLNGSEPCNCPDAIYRRVHCKHFLASALVHLMEMANREQAHAKRCSQTAALSRAAAHPGRPLWYEVS